MAASTLTELYQGKKIFISGGAGVIGQALVEELLPLNAHIYVGDIKPKPASFPPSLHYRQGDLNYITPEELEGIAPDYFFHLAASFERTQENYTFWGENFQNNVRLSHHLMSLLKDTASLQSVVFASSYLIYDAKQYLFSTPPKAPISLKESDPIYPRNLTGCAKLSHEVDLQFLSHFKNETCKFIAARIFRGYGLGSKDIISRWVRALLNNQPIETYNKESFFDYLYCKDSAKGLLSLLRAKRSGIYNLGTGKARKVEDVLKILKQYFPKATIKSLSDQPPFEACEANMSDTFKATNWEASYTLEDAIPEIIAYETKHTPRENPQPKGILFSSVSKKAPHILALKKSVQAMGVPIKVWGADVNPQCLGRHLCDHFWEMPPLQELSTNALLDFCKKNNISWIIPSRDGELRYFSERASLLKENGIHPMVSSPEVIDKCLDKLAFFNHLKNNNILTPQTSINLEPWALNSSLVVKERYGAASHNIEINISSKEASLHAKKLQHPLYQQYIIGSEFSVDCYVDKNNTPRGIFPRWRQSVSHGESQVTTTFRSKELESTVEHLLLTLQVTGHCVLQGIHSPREGKNYIIELNPRIGGASTLSMECGLKSFYWFICEAQGTLPKAFKIAYPEPGKTLIRVPQDIITKANQFFKGSTDNVVQAPVGSF